MRTILQLLLLLVSLAAPARAHDFGAMKVSALFGADAQLTVEAVIDTESLPDSVRPPRESDSPVELRRFAESFLRSATVLLDEREASSQLAGQPVLEPSASGSPTVTIRMRIDLPPEARDFRWSHAWPRGQYMLRIVRETSAESPDDAETTIQWLDGRQTSEPLALNARLAPSDAGSTIIQYLHLGFTHIVPKGLDHILFVLGLFLLSMKARPILAQVTAFTVAHTITLGLSMYGVVRMPSSLVEPLIALSIAYVAIENVCTTKLKPWRTLIVFAFGLLHGMGFAGVLSELGLPRGQFLPALLSFNVGVEAGQLFVIASAYLAVGFWFEMRPWYRARITVPASCAIALVGLVWTAERVLA
jgi:hydrogenase/urease accessory protein HupE